MDEPFGALDAQLKLLMLDQLQELTRQRRMTVVFVTHDLGEAITLADRVVVFSARPGRIRTIRDVTCRGRATCSACASPRHFAHLHEAAVGRAEGRSGARGPTYEWAVTARSRRRDPSASRLPAPRRAVAAISVATGAVRGRVCRRVGSLLG